MKTSTCRTFGNVRVTFSKEKDGMGSGKYYEYVDDVPYWAVYNYHKGTERYLFTGNLSDISEYCYNRKPCTLHAKPRKTAKRYEAAHQEYWLNVQDILYTRRELERMQLIAEETGVSVSHCGDIFAPTIEALAAFLFNWIPDAESVIDSLPDDTSLLHKVFYLLNEFSSNWIL